MRIETDRLIIRSLARDDAAVFAEMARDGSLSDIGFDADCAAWIDDWIKEALALSAQDDAEKDYIACTVCLKRSGTVIGSIGCSYYKDLKQVGITFFIGQSYRKNGFAAESIRAYRDYFFAHYPQKKLIATVRETNTPSWKAIEKCAFRLTETKLYRDQGDDAPLLYRFYECTKGDLRI
ncbi:MAG: hypothetical protein CW335_01300 [Clostridiales bacterium]|nr:hypothetical protein [Clostridiales bacterium]